MIPIKDLIELNKEVSKLYKKGVMDISTCGNNEIHLTGDLFHEMFKEWEEVLFYGIFGVRKAERFVEIDGVRFFCLVDVEEE